MNIYLPYRLIFIVGLLFFLLCARGQAQNSSEESYCESFPFNCSMVTNFYQQYKPEIDGVAQRLTVDPAFLLAIVSPEIANFNIIQNELEYRTVEVFYVNLGDDYANFSIGYFQMKPIFAKQIEREIQNRKGLTIYRSEFDYPDKDELEVRRARVKRLNDVKWQMAYLEVFFKIMQIKHKDVIFKNSREKLAFYAAAYNRGYTHSEQEIRRWVGVRWFPNYGEAPSIAYARVALELLELLKE